MDEIQRIILDVQNKDKLRDLNAELEKEEQLLTQLVRINAAFSTAPTVAAMEAAATKVRDLNQQIGELEKSSGHLRSGGLLQLSYVLDDLANTSGGWERKLASISNNIPGLVAGLGGSMGVAGAIGLVGTALIALTPVARAAWEALMGGEAPHEVADVLDKLADKAKGLRGELEKLLKSQGSEERDTQRAFEEYAQGHGNEILGGIAQTLFATGRTRALTQEDAIALRSVEHAVPWLREAVRSDIFKRIQPQLLEEAGALLAKAPTDRGARDTIRALARANPGAFAGISKNFAGELEEVEPEAREKQREFEERVDAIAEEGKKISERFRRERKDEKRASAEARRRADQGVRELERNRAEELREEERRKADERRAVDDELRDSERRDADNKRVFDQSKRTRPVRRAAAQVRDVARAHGFELGPEQLTEAGRAAVEMTSRGLDAQQAALTAFLQQLEAMQRVQARAAAMQQQWQGMAGWQAHLGTGADWSGQFSAMPPMFGGGFGFSG